ncbi:MAG: HAD family hydrolase, partial [Patescibacteria group bacterium]|nr:HAD family hydrolase [Patescibacteria group bacterium]
MTAHSKQLIIFDLDGTLTKSKSPVDPEMAALLVRLLSKKKVAVISGGSYVQFQAQFLASLPGSADHYGNLYLLPTSGTRLYTWKGSWVEEYAENLTPAERERVMNALNTALAAAGYKTPEKHWGDIIEDRGSQIT